MKSIYLFLAGVIAAIPSFSQKPTVVNPKIKEVTVYLSGAEIRFKEPVALKQGTNVVQFKGLSSSLDESSVQVTVGEGVEIVSVSTASEKLKPEQVKPAIKLLKDSIAAIEDQIVLITNQVDAYAMERKTLSENQHLPNNQSNLVELSKAADFFRERTLKINNALFELDKNFKALNSTLASKKERLEDEIRTTNTKRYTITATVNSKTDHTEEFFLRHLVENASWQASYDIVAVEIGKPIVLKYKAIVYNDSDVDWKNVQLYLSTGDAFADASRPYLTTWTLNYRSTANEGALNQMVQRRGDVHSDSIGSTEVSVGELSKVFTVDRVHTIAAKEPYRVELQDDTLPASFEYLVVPKVEPSAFLIAKITGWERLNLIQGKANVYFGNSFIGESNINPAYIGDTLDLSLGRDNQIAINRTKAEDKASNQFIGGKRTESLVYEIQIKNNRKVGVSIRTQDQIPISQESDIVVEASDISGAALDAPSGRLQWLRDLKPGEAVKYRIAFSVKYPKNKNVSIRQNRVVRTPRYKQ